MSAQTVLWHILDMFRKGRNAKISEITETLQITRKECMDSLHLIAEQLEPMGYILVPGYTSRVDASGKALLPDENTMNYTHKAESLKKCDFVYITKKEECTEEENMYINEHVSEILYVFMVLYLNGSELQYEKVLGAMKKIERDEDTMKELINKKYFYKKKRNDEHFIRPGWKFFIEFPDFSPEEYLAIVKTSSV
ncbi:hypothetical protein NEAUS07_2096 [Nematocida ausubeli]|nr:hypothetical protein NEAUS07_2096 [Nematocida ausubeli]